VTISHRIEGSELISKREGKARLRRGIFADWGDGCAYCGADADTLDHVRPQARGGITARENLVPACSCCNLSKGHADALEWFRAHHGWSPGREQRLLDWIRIR
jgi:5-methylcytosine-specific restriction endonuclease McrA